jgi:hypothetical protein
MKKENLFMANKKYVVNIKNIHRMLEILEEGSGTIWSHYYDAFNYQFKDVFYIELKKRSEHSPCIEKLTIRLYDKYTKNELYIVKIENELSIEDETPIEWLHEGVWETIIQNKINEVFSNYKKEEREFFEKKLRLPSIVEA